MQEDDWVVVRGNTFGRTYTFLIDGVAEDLSSATFRCQIRKSRLASEIMAQPEIDVSQAAQGRITLRMPNGITSSLLDGVWDLEQHLSGVYSTRVGGKVHVIIPVTR